MHILYLRVSEKNSRRIRNYKIHYSEKVYRDPAFQTFEIVHMVHTRIFPALTEFASLTSSSWNLLFSVDQLHSCQLSR